MTKPHKPAYRPDGGRHPYDTGPPLSARQAGSLALLGAALAVALALLGVAWQSAGLPVLDEPAAVEVPR